MTQPRLVELSSHFPLRWEFSGFFNLAIPWFFTTISAFILRDFTYLSLIRWTSILVRQWPGIVNKFDDIWCERTLTAPSDIACRWFWNCYLTWTCNFSFDRETVLHWNTELKDMYRQRCHHLLPNRISFGEEFREETPAVSNDFVLRFWLRTSFHSEYAGTHRALLSNPEGARSDNQEICFIWHLGSAAMRLAELSCIGRCLI